MLEKLLPFALALFVLATSTAQAQDAPNPEKFTPKGYEFCGWRDSQAPSGYRCKTLGSEYEYSDVRCAKRGKPETAFRVRSGA